MARKAPPKRDPAEGFLAFSVLLLCLFIGWGVLGRRTQEARWAVAVVPVGDINPMMLDDLARHLSREHRLRVLPAISPPPLAWDAARGQYDAEKFLQGLDGLPLQPDEKLLAVADVDAGTPDLTIVFGLAEQGGVRAAIFTRRLTDGAVQSQWQHRLLTTARHELGHLAGLTHCASIVCAMPFSQSVNDTDIKGPEFCEYCQRAWDAAHE